MWNRSTEELRRALAMPFANGDIEWRVSATTKDKTRGLAVPYVTNRAIQNRLDDTVGVDGHNCWNVSGHSGLLVPSRNKDGLIQGLQVRLDGETDAKRKYPLALQQGPGPGRPQPVLDPRYRKHPRQDRLSHRRGIERGRGQLPGR